MLGSPIGHSLSPVLHRAAFAALGLRHWRYDAIECDDTGLPAFVAGLGPEWAGLSVTMPGKRAALELADSASEVAELVGVANTLVQVRPGHWLADCTDVAGVTGALRSAGVHLAGRAVVIGAGGTACAAIAGLAELGAGEQLLVARDAARAGAAVRCADRAGVSLRVLPFGGVELAAACAAADVVVSTVPAGVADPLAECVAGCPVLLDVVYHPWPPVIATAVGARGGRVVTGLDMLLHQAFDQAERFTGQPAPRAAMRAALVEAAPAGVLIGAVDNPD